MKVSVIIATYNRAKLIVKSIESILSQTHADLELIIVDDGSTDDTEQVVATYQAQDARIRYVPLAENQGATTARNRGIIEARGDLIMVWDSDDELHEHALERVVDTFSRQPELGIVSAPCRQQLKDGSERPYRSVPAGEVQLSQIVCKYLPDNEKVRVARAEIFKQVRYEARNIDFMVNGYLAELGRWYHLDEELGVLHLESDSVSLTLSRRKPNITRSLERVEPLLRFFANFGELLKANCPSRYAALAYGLALGLLLRGDRTLARRYAKEASRLDDLPLYRKLYLLSCLPGAAFILRVLYKFGQSTS